jgi:hypothetical protein
MYVFTASVFCLDMPIKIARRPKEEKMLTNKISTSSAQNKKHHA